MKHQTSSRLSQRLLSVCYLAMSPRRQKYKLSQSSPHGACSVIRILSRAFRLEGNKRERWLITA